MNGALQQVEWESPLVEPVPDPALQSYAGWRGGSEPRVLNGYFPRRRHRRLLRRAATQSVAVERCRARRLAMRAAIREYTVELGREGLPLLGLGIGNRPWFGAGRLGGRARADGV